MQQGPGTGLGRCLRAWQRWASGETGPGRVGTAVLAVAAVAEAAARRDGAPAALLEPLAAAAAPRAVAPGRPGTAELPAGLAAETVRAASADAVTVPHLLGLVYEAALSASARRRGGVFYTPGSVAQGLVGLACDGVAGSSPALDGSADCPDGLLVVADPAMGSGAFLLAAAERFRQRCGVSGAACVAALRGCDIDPGAVAVARTALAWWAWTIDDVPWWPSPEAVRSGDGLALPGPGGPPPGPVDVVVGNPPFLNQLQGVTARSAASRKLLQGRFGDAAKGYVDTALLFLLAALDLVAEGGRVVLVQPESTLVGAHGARARADIERRARLEGLWIGGGDVFAAGVRVCAPVLRRVRETAGPGASGGPFRLWAGAPVIPSGRIDVDSPQPADSLRESDSSSAPAASGGGPVRPMGEWAPLLAVGRGVPSVSLRGAGRLGDLTTATAGFRDQFYGLAPYVHEHPGAALSGIRRPAAPSRGSVDEPVVRWAPLVTSGLLRLGRLRWGEVPVRFAGRRWSRPAVDLEALAEGDPSLYRWVARRLRPKLVLATQTSVVVFAPDLGGLVVPSVPVVAVEPDDGSAARTGPFGAVEPIWMVAAVLAAPVVSAHAATRFAGAGLSAGAFRLGAKQVLALPTPIEAEPWREAALLLRGTGAVPADLGVWQRCGELMAQAYGVPADKAGTVRRWWAAEAARHLPATDL